MKVINIEKVKGRKYDLRFTLIMINKKKIMMIIKTKNECAKIAEFLRILFNMTNE